MSRLARTRWYLLAAVLLGVVTNIGVAWFFAARQDMFSYSYRYVRLSRPPGVTTGPDGVWIQEHRHLGCRGWMVSYEVGVNRPDELATSSAVPLRVASWAARWVKPWEGTASAWPAFGAPAVPYAIIAGEVRAHGWPLPALCWRRGVEDTTGPNFYWESHGGLVVPWLRTPDGISPRTPLVVPYRPLALGFA